jgi:hypothetical protein
MQTVTLYRPVGPKELTLVGAAVHRELWVPAEELDEFNRHIVGRIEVTCEFHANRQG